MIDTLKQNYPNSKIDFMVNNRVSELVKDYPNINKVQSIEKDSLRDIKKICREGDYDLAIVVRPLFITALAVFLSGIKFRLGTGYRWYSFLFNIKHYEHRKYSVKHELEYNLSLLDELECEHIKDPYPKLTISDEILGSVRGKLISMGIDNDKPFIIIHPGSLGSAKTWSSNNFSKLVSLLTEDNLFKHKVILTGTKSENVILNAVANEVKNKDNIHIINDLGIKEFGALCKFSAMFISNSTGPIHIAAAVGTFCVGFFSPVRQESAVRWAPYTERKKIFSPGNVSGAGDVMDKIKPEEVRSFIMDYLYSNN